MRRRSPPSLGLRKRFQWAVIGAGPAGITAVGKLLDNGVSPRTIVWVDPEFKVGDLGTKWAEVSSNTTVGRFEEFLRSCASFGIDGKDDEFPIFSMDPKSTCLLKEVVEPLRWISDRLSASVVAVRSTVQSVGSEGGAWHVVSAAGELVAGNVVLAVGAQPRLLDHPIPQVSLEEALDPRRLAGAVSREDTVAVFGSSHSAVLAVRNLLNVGVGRVVNFYRSPLRFAVDHGDWILYDNTGLKGVTAQWARSEMPRLPAERLLRVKVDGTRTTKHLAQCTKVVYGIGFEPRKLRVHGAEPKRYDRTTGIIAPGLFGCGIAFPERVVDRAGNVEYNVGLLKFARFLDRVVPVWMGKSGRSERRGVTSVGRPAR